MNVEVLRSTLQAIARLEAADVRPPRLTEAGHEKWLRFRRKLGWRHFIELLHEDLANAFPMPFDTRRWESALIDALSEDEAEALVEECAVPPSADTATFLRDRAQALGLAHGGALSDVPKVQPRHQVLELAGSGGRIAAAQCLQHEGLALHQNFTFVARSEAERIAIGLATVELRANEPLIVASVDDLPAKTRFDRVVGLRECHETVDLPEGFPEVRLV